MKQWVFFLSSSSSSKNVKAEWVGTRGRPATVSCVVDRRFSERGLGTQRQLTPELMAHYWPWHFSFSGCQCVRGGEIVFGHKRSPFFFFSSESKAVMVTSVLPMIKGPWLDQISRGFVNFKKPCHSLSNHSLAVCNSPLSTPLMPSHQIAWNAFICCWIITSINNLVIEVDVSL